MWEAPSILRKATKFRKQPATSRSSNPRARRIAMYSFNASSSGFIVRLQRWAKGAPVCAGHRSRVWRRFPLCWGFDVEEFLRFHSCLRQNEASSLRDCVSARGLPLTPGINPPDRARGERSWSMSKVRQSQNAARVRLHEGAALYMGDDPYAG